MKHLHVLMVTAVLAWHMPTAEAQPYEPMVVEGAHWVIREIQSYPLQAQNPTQRAACRYIAGDTLLNGVGYKKVYQAEVIVDPDNLFPEPEAPFIRDSLTQLIALMREDTAARKVYAIMLLPFIGYQTVEFVVGVEQLAYDYARVAGDTLYEFGTGVGGVVDSVSTVYVWGKNRRFLYSSIQGGYNLCEGLGPNQLGLFVMATQPPGFDRVFSLLYYCQGSAAGCEIYTTGLGDELAGSLRLYPNPVVADALLELPEAWAGRPMQYTVVDLTGRIWAYGDVQAQSTKLSLEALPPGVYGIQVRELDTDRGFFSRFVKN